MKNKFAHTTKKMVKPPPLRKGDEVAITAASGPVEPERLAAGAMVLESLGLKVKTLYTPRRLSENRPFAYAKSRKTACCRRFFCDFGTACGVFGQSAPSEARTIDPPIEVCQANSNHPPKRGDCDTNIAERFNWC
ncbi:MAG: hypothetical protein FWF79_06940, partial [Defluviitaleaceae bacterium]|nr:hypothetical protein [Defluviitaleaceae bacterium]